MKKKRKVSTRKWFSFTYFRFEIKGKEMKDNNCLGEIKKKKGKQ